MSHADEPSEADLEKRQVAKSSTDDRARRQSDLLDEGLLETFPASDPVSVARVK